MRNHCPLPQWEQECTLLKVSNQVELPLAGETIRLQIMAYDNLKSQNCSVTKVPVMRIL